MAASRLVKRWPAALLAGGLCLCLSWLGGPAGTPLVPPVPLIAARPATPPAGEMRAQATPWPQPATATAAPRQPQPQSQPAARLTALLAAPGGELRASILQALAARADGGRLYARALARRCADLASLPGDTAALDVNAPAVQHAMRRRDALLAGCQQLTPGERQTLVNLAADEGSAGDPLLALQQSDLDDAALLQAVVARPDALLIEELGERLLLRRMGGQPQLYFDGQTWSDDAARTTAQAALRLLPCHFGLVCDDRDPEVWLDCLRGERCTASRADGATPEARALARRMAEALRAGAVERFVPGGPPVAPQPKAIDASTT